MSPDNTTSHPQLHSVWYTVEHTVRGKKHVLHKCFFCGCLIGLGGWESFPFYVHCLLASVLCICTSMYIYTYTVLIAIYTCLCINVHSIHEYNIEVFTCIIYNVPVETERGQEDG